MGFVDAVLIPITCAATLTVNQSSTASLYSEVSKLIEQHYMDPLGIGTARLQEQISALAKQCTACSSNAAEAQLKTWFEQLGDFHLRLRPGILDDTAAPRVINAASSTTRYGFDAANDDTRLVVTWTHPSFPAAEAGLRPGDVILSVLGKRDTPQGLYASIAVNEFASRRLKLGIQRRDGSRRELIFNPSTALLSSYATRVGNATVITVPAMDGNLTDQAVFKMLKTASSDGTERIVLDLRHHIGGNPFTAARIASAFLERVETAYVDKAGTKIIYNMNGAVKRYEITSSPEKNNTETITQWAAWKGPVTILVDERTESIGETFTVLMQRAKRGSVIGSRTAGGGGVLANLFRLQSGATLQITTHFILDADEQRLPMQVNPDINLALDLPSLVMGRDSQLEAALR